MPYVRIAKKIGQSRRRQTAATRIKRVFCTCSVHRRDMLGHVSNVRGPEAAEHRSQMSRTVRDDRHVGDSRSIGDSSVIASCPTDDHNSGSKYRAISIHDARHIGRFERMRWKVYDLREDRFNAASAHPVPSCTRGARISIPRYHLGAN
jgi:hypothetical protein